MQISERGCPTAGGFGGPQVSCVLSPLRSMPFQSSWLRLPTFNQITFSPPNSSATSVILFISGEIQEDSEFVKTFLATFYPFLHFRRELKPLFFKSVAHSPGCLLNLPGEPSKIKLKCPEIVLLLIRSGVPSIRVLPTPPFP